MPVTSTRCGAARRALQLVLGYIGHNVALLALPVALAALALALAAAVVDDAAAAPAGTGHARLGARANPGVNLSQALNIWIIQAIVASVRRSARWSSRSIMKTDWGISLFFLVPLALVAIPALRVQSAGAVQHRRDLAGDELCHARRLAPDRGV